MLQILLSRVFLPFSKICSFLAKALLCLGSGSLGEIQGSPLSSCVSSGWEGEGFLGQLVWR